MAQVPRSAPRAVLPSDSLSYMNPKEFILGGITVTGAKNLDNETLITISKLTKGEKITLPGDANANVIKNLYSQGLFDDVQLNITKINLDTIYLEIAVQERPRLSRLHITGIRKGEAEDLQKKLNDKTNKIVNENLLSTSTAIIKRHFNEKGYLNTTVTINQRPDPGDPNSIILDIVVDKKQKVMINSITFEGNKDLSSARLKKMLGKSTRTRKWYNLFGSKKFKPNKFDEDKQKLIENMQAKGYRDADVLSDTIKNHDGQTVDIKFKIHEGPKYYFGDIKWSGNAKYSDTYLNQILKIKKGDIFSEDALNKRLTGSGENSDDISTLYLNDGYLTFNADPVQTRVHNDTVDLEIRMFEGPQYTINRVSVRGNDITNDKVVMREIKTIPGQKFSKAVLIRSTRDIGQLGNFDDTKTDPKIMPNPQDATVDILYNVVEKPSDQVELSGGFGGGQLVGTLGLTFNNFSLRNIFHLKDYKPLPKGDGQKLSLRGQSSGKTYQNYSFTFSEPWLGGKKPIYFAVSAYTQLSSTGFYYDVTNPLYNKLRINGVGVTLGKKLKWPDDLFQLNYSLNFDHYNLDNFTGFLFTNGTSYNIKLTQELTRNSLDQLIFPTSGSNIRLTIQATPPYSAFNNINYRIATQEQRYHFVEYYKFKFDAQNFTRLFGKFVLMEQVRFGFLGQYNSIVGPSPFERFKLGGDGMQSYQFLQGSEIVGLRGYTNFSIVPVGSNYTANNNPGSPIYNKITFELRHPVISGQSATIFLLAFAEGGNTWNNFSQFNPFNVRRSAGIGARIFLPIFGLLGLDYGYGFDAIPGNPSANKGQVSFSISQSITGGFN